MSAIGKPEVPPAVCWLNQRKYLSAVLELEAAASMDRRRIYDGREWTVGSFREYLKGGSGLVAVNQHGTVVGFALYSRTDEAIYVPKLVAQSLTAENALLQALRLTQANNGKKLMHLPLVIDLE